MRAALGLANSLASLWKVKPDRRRAIAMKMVGQRLMGKMRVRRAPSIQEMGG